MALYLPHAFNEQRADVLQSLIQANPFATLIVNTEEGLLANHLPMAFVEEGAHGVLRGHIARANPLWRQYQEGDSALAVFQGPDAYISPNFYPSKAATGQVVPTWNYAVVHARGVLRFIHDTAWLRGLVGHLTDRHEQASAQPWQVDDAPPEFTAKQLGLIVGVELPISTLVGKFKLSQNRTPADREGVREGLSARGTAADAEMLALLKR